MTSRGRSTIPARNITGSENTHGTNRIPWNNRREPPPTFCKIRTFAPMYSIMKMNNRKNEGRNGPGNPRADGHSIHLSAQISWSRNMTAATRHSKPLRPKGSAGVSRPEDGLNLRAPYFAQWNSHCDVSPCPMPELPAPDHHLTRLYRIGEDPPGQQQSIPDRRSYRHLSSLLAKY